MALAKTLDDKRLQDFSEGADQQLRLSPSLLRLQSAIADVHVPEGRSELDDELSAKLQQLGMQLFSFQEHLAHVIGPKALNVRRHSHSPPESCSSQDLGHILSSDPSTSFYQTSSSCSRMASPRVWDSRLSTPPSVNIPHLCEMLLDPSPAVQAAAAGSLRSLTCSTAYCCAAVEAGAVPALVQLMAKSQSQDTQGAAIGVLWNLAACPNTRETLSEAGAVKAVVHVLGSSTSTADLQHQAVSLLADLISNDSTSSSSSSETVAAKEAMLQQMTAAGAIPLLLSLLPSQQQQDIGTVTAHVNAATPAALQFLKALAQIPANRPVLAAAGASSVLASLLTSYNNSSSSSTGTSNNGSRDPVPVMAASILQQLCQESADHADVSGAGGVEELVVLLESGNCDVQASAAGAVGSLATSSEGLDASTEAAAGAAAAIPALLDLLASSSQPVQAAVAGALQKLACSDANRQQIAAADGVAMLGQLLCDTATNESLCNTGDDATAGSTSRTLANAALALQNLAVDPDNCKSATAADSPIPTLVELLQHSSSRVVAAAAGCLANLAWDAAGCAAIAGCDGVMGRLVQCAQSSDCQVALNSVNLVGKLAWEPELCESIAAAGALEVLINLLPSHAETSSSHSLAEAAAAALQNLTYEDHNIRQTCIDDGILAVLSRILRDFHSALAHGCKKVYHHALATDQFLSYVLGVLFNLALEPATAAAAAEAGVIEPLVGLLDCNSESLSAAAGRIIGKLASDPAVRQAIGDCRKEGRLQEISN